MDKRSTSTIQHLDLTWELSDALRLSDLLSGQVMVVEYVAAIAEGFVVTVVTNPSAKAVRMNSHRR